VRNEDTPRTNAVAYDVGGVEHSEGSIVPVEFARGLERELENLHRKDRLKTREINLLTRESRRREKRK